MCIRDSLRPGLPVARHGARAAEDRTGVSRRADRGRRAHPGAERGLGARRGAARPARPRVRHGAAGPVRPPDRPRRHLALLRRRTRRGDRPFHGRGRGGGGGRRADPGRRGPGDLPALRAAERYRRLRQHAERRPGRRHGAGGTRGQRGRHRVGRRPLRARFHRCGRTDHGGEPAGRRLGGPEDPGVPDRRGRRLALPAGGPGAAGPAVGPGRSRPPVAQGAVLLDGRRRR